MIAELRRRFRMLAPDRRVRWASMAPLGLATAVLDMAGGAIVFALLELLLDPSSAVAAPLRPLSARLGGTPIALAIAAAVVHVSRSLLGVAFACWRAHVAAVDAAALATRALGLYMAAPWPFHLRRAKATTIETIRESSRPFFDAFDAAATILSEAATVIALALLSLAVAPVEVSLAVAATAACAAVAVRTARAAQHRGGLRQFELGAALFAHVEHGLGALKEARVLGRERHFVDAFSRDVSAAAALETRRAALDAAPRALLETVFGLGMLALVALGAARGTLAETLPLVGLYAYAGFRIVPALHRIAVQAGSLRWSLAASAPLVEDLSRLGEAPLANGSAAERLELRHALVAENVTFAYEEGAPPVLDRVNLTIRPGESVAIAGPTGTGKTTLVDVLIGLLPPSSGRVLVDGRDISAAPAAWHRSIGYVPQMPFLMDDTVRRNVALGLPDAAIDEAALARAVSLARLDEVVRALPAGLDTRLGDRGVRLSGGERQRIAIARALYRDPAVLVFDEATSALDLDTERDLAAAIDALRGRTMLVVAHRPATAARCDRVLVVAGGRVTPAMSASA